MRMVLSDMFKKQPDFEVVATATNGKDAVEKVKTLKPDLVTMDVNMPVLDGLQEGDRVIVSGYDRFGEAEVLEWGK